MYLNQWGEMADPLGCALKCIESAGRAGIRLACSPGGRNANQMALDEAEFVRTLPEDLRREVGLLIDYDPQEFVERYFELFEELHQRFNGDGTRVLFGPNWVQGCTDDFLRRIGERARELGGVPIHIHTLQSPVQKAYGLRRYGKSLLVHRLHRVSGFDLGATPALDARTVLRMGTVNAARVCGFWTVFAWCLMSNHYHLALRVGPIPLSRTLGYVQARFGQSYNRRHRSTGPLWQSRFKAKLVEEPRYLDQLVLYIHLNPVTAGVVDDPSGWGLSGHSELLRSTPGALIDAEQTLSLFGGSIRAAWRRYVRALEGAREVEWRTELPGGLPWWRRETDRPVDPRPPAVWIDEQRLSTASDRPPVRAEEFLVGAALGLGLEPQTLTAAGSSHAITRSRSLVAALAVERWRLRPVDLAPLFGRRADVVSRWVRWGVVGRHQDTEFREAYDRLDRYLCAQLGDVPPPDRIAGS